MGRKLDLSGLTDDEAEHVLKVVQRDMKLRKKEEDRLSEMKQELAEEGSRCSILSKQHRFNEHCCIRCCSPFTFLVNPKRPCLDCQYNVCKTCRTYSKREKAWLCTVCQKTRILRTQSLEWYYNNVKSRFKRFGSAKVLKTLYRNHIVERGGILDLPESSVHDGSNDNDGSVCGSDSTFYRQSEGHSMAETLTVALRVAEEAIEEAIANAEEFSDSLEKQNEARYLRDHKEELIEELATTIVQKIIQRRKHSEMQTEYDFVWPQRPSQGQPQGSELSSPSQHPHSTLAQANQAHLKSSYSLWRSRSAFSLTSDDSPEKVTEALMGAGGGVQDYASLKKETARASSLPSWKSVDRLDNSSASSVLQSPDGNWIALQSSQHSRPSLLAKRKSLVFSVLEKESGVVSAYDEMGSDSDQENDKGGWGAALRQFRQKLSDETYYTDSQHDPEWTYTPVHLPVTSPSSGQYTNTETVNSDSESSSVHSARPRKPFHNVMGRKGPNSDSHLHPQQAQYHHHHQHQNFPSYPLHPEALDVNFNPKVTGDSSEAEDSMQSNQVRRSRRRRKSKREAAGNQTHTQPLYAQSVQENSILLNGLLKRGMSEEMAAPDVVPEAMTPEPEDQDTVAPNSAAPSPRNPMTPDPLSTSSTGPGSGDTLEQELRSKLSQLVGRANSKEVVSSSEDEPIKSPGGRDRESDRPKETLRQNEREGDRQRQSERPRDRPRSKSHDRAKRETIESVKGPELKKRERLTERPILTEEERVKERRLGRGGKSLEEKVDDREEKRVEKNRLSKRPQGQEVDRKTEKKGEQVEDQNEKTGSTPTSLAITPSVQEGVLCDGQKYSAASLCSITTEVLKVLNATEELIGEAGGDSVTPSECMSASESFSSSLETRELDQKLTKMEENVYLAAGAVYGLEGALGDLEEVARDISSSTSDRELAFLEDQVATAATQVQQSELQISDIEVRILSLKTAGLNVTACNRFSKFPKPKPKPQTLDTSRQQRRKLPAPPAKDKESEQQVRALQPY
ncbi:rab effector MyRIP isoform X1 [Oncorhynchus kisutch]|uniref:Myosin VIIA and Rab interacting protein b n=1 Tax=Oncorhynchus kisutch TaxID=8019 RepID=A0A8C7MFC6_ONCKI|nr:rab effector MyRIP isoform X1 [Oncorhynchus kisutch]